MPENFCLACGACCAFYRASFYFAEADDITPGGVPAELCERRSEFLLQMKGTSGPRPWCAALMGIVGKSVRCEIYERRASPCRDFVPSWKNGLPNERCDKARAAWGLEPLTPDVWPSPKGFPRAA